MDFSENKLILEAKLRNSLKDKFNMNQTPVDQIIKHKKHLSYIFKYLINFRISNSYDIQKSWLAYWGLNALAILGEFDELTLPDRSLFAKYVLSFQDPKGGFSGGQGYPVNMVSTYASILALALLDILEANQQINVPGLEKFMLSCQGKVPGSYHIHDHGEIDIRCSFIAVLLSSLLHITNPLITENIADFIVSCQTFEGGISPFPAMEAHGGYTYCGVAALSLLGKLEKLNLKKLLFWLINCQTEFGGFCGRTNKLVDSCYSFWQASSFHIIQEYLDLLYPKPESSKNDHVLYDTNRLQVYVLECCQDDKGGLKDKPGKEADIYHTMYALAGLALSSQTDDLSEIKTYKWDNYFFEEMDPVSNIPRIKANKFTMFFREINK